MSLDSDGQGHDCSFAFCYVFPKYNMKQSTDNAIIPDEWPSMGKVKGRYLELIVLNTEQSQWISAGYASLPQISRSINNGGRKRELCTVAPRTKHSIPN